MSLRIAIIGMGGFAGVHHDGVLALERAGECRLVCACDPNMAGFAARQAALGFTERGVRLFTDYREMLCACREELDILTIPTPVPLHAEMHRAGVEAGLAVYLEKPPTLNAAELEAMLAVEAQARLQTNVGFNFIVDPVRQGIKHRLVAGEFGALRRVAIHAVWPRADSYYARAAWAGRLRMGGQLVLDSCMGNAMAHQVHNGLFWGGSDACWSWGEISAVRAELYRAHGIEGTDTVFVRAWLAQGATVDIAMTHACAGAQRQGERIECDRATLTYQPAPTPDDAVQCAIRWTDGTMETDPPAQIDFFRENLRAYFAYVRGEVERPITQLIDSRPFVHLNSLAYIAAGRIAPIPPANTTRVPAGEGAGTFAAIDGIDAAVDRFVDTGEFPSEQGLAWAAPGGEAGVGDLPRLSAVIEQMINGCAAGV